jgi:cytoskeleton protein RodZ
MPSIGDTLREARMRQRLDIADVEAKTKIRAKYLRALENEEFGMLPGPTFVKTFLRSYAEVLGLDPHLLVEDYRARYEARDDSDTIKSITPAGLARDRRRRSPRPPGPLLLLGLAVLAVVATLLVIGLVGGEDDPDEGAGQEETSPRPRRERPERREEPPPPRRVVLRIAPEVETYVCVDTGPGTEVRFEGSLFEPRTFRGRRLRVNLGNTSVAVRANGKPVDIGAGPDPVGFAFTPGATTPLPAGRRPCL